MNVTVVQHNNAIVKIFEDHREAFEWADKKYGKNYTISGQPVKTKEA